MTARQSRLSQVVVIRLVEVVVWLLLFTVAWYSVFVSSYEVEPAASQQDYMFGYLLLSMFLSLILAGVLVSPFKENLDLAHTRLTTIALPAFLVAALLHISLWGVSASQWLTNLQPRVGNFVWMFIRIGVPFAIVLVVTYMLRLSLAAAEPAPLDTEIMELPARRRRRTSQKARRNVWFILVSIAYIVLFVLFVLGSMSTASGIGGDWFKADTTTWTHVTVVMTMLIITAALIAAAMMAQGRQWRREDEVLLEVEGESTESSGERSSANPGGNKKASPYVIILGPVVIAVMLLIISAAVLAISVNSIRGDFRLNTGIVLFVSYSSALLPSYAVFSVLRLSRL